MRPVVPYTSTGTPVESSAWSTSVWSHPAVRGSWSRPENADASEFAMGTSVHWNVEPLPGASSAGFATA